jgi:hypothetical protein
VTSSTGRLAPDAPRAVAAAVWHSGASALAWALFVGAWLVLGALGRATSPLWFAGLGPVATWLAVAAFAGLVTRRRPMPPGVVLVALAATAGGLAIGLRAGSAGAVLAAAAGCGVLSCVVSRRVDAVEGIAFAPGCAGSSRPPTGPADWPVIGARWAMLPMMAALGLQSDWCAGIGLSPVQGIALHLVAMLAPAVLLWLSPPLRALRAPAWIAAVMAAGVAVLPLAPGVRGWMAMSLVHACAWSLAWSRDVAGPRDAPSRPAAPVVGDAWRAACPAVAVLALGAAIDAFGLDGLVAVHVALGAASLAGAAAWRIARSRRQARSGHEETRA